MIIKTTKHKKRRLCFFFIFPLHSIYALILFIKTDQTDRRINLEISHHWLSSMILHVPCRYGCSLAPLAYEPDVFAYPEIALGFPETARENAARRRTTKRRTDGVYRKTSSLVSKQKTRRGQRRGAASLSVAKGERIAALLLIRRHSPGRNETL